MKLIIILAICLFIASYVIKLYNNIVRLNNKVKEAFSTMDVYLKKRWDLIPNMVETVKGYAKHENNTLKEVVALRNASYSNLSDEDKLKTNAQLSAGITKIMALAESYPELKADQNFIHLSGELSKIETDIANARKYYNGVVREFNNTVEIFPNNIVAKLFNFEAKPMFVVDENERENVKVQF